jgi:hypothetical protein
MCFACCFVGRVDECQADGSTLREEMTRMRRKAGANRSFYHYGDLGRRRIFQ